MRDILPAHLVDFLRDRYIAGVAMAEASYAESSADEDAITGALGQAIAMPTPTVFSGPQGIYEVKISYRKVRGRGRDAPERLYGSDGIFQITVTDEHGEVVRQKGLPFQSKKNWSGRNSALADQARDMQSSTGEGLIIDFTPNGYSACGSSLVAEVNGDRREVDRQRGTRPLGVTLGIDFLNCTVGRVGLFYDSEKERYMENDNLVPPRHALTTIVKAVR